MHVRTDPSQEDVMPDELSPQLLAAAEAGNANAQNEVGRFYALRDAGPESTAQAVTWFERAAAQGFTVAKHNLGMIAWRDNKDDVARRWFQVAVEEGYVESMYPLGAILEKEGNLKAAADLYAEAGAKGHADAQWAIGCLMLSKDTDEAYRAAKGWAELASEQGHAGADVVLATIYHEGLGVERDPERAASYFLSAAEAGHVMAQYMIGIAYDVGAGVAASRADAAFWLMLSSPRNADAKYYLDTRIAPHLTRDDRSALVKKLRERGIDAYARDE
jgi:TPR repeat protein